MAVAGSLVVTIQAKTDAFESGMRKVRTEVQSTQKAVSSAQSGFQALSTSLVGLTAGVLSVQALSTAMKDVVKVGIEMQNLRQSFAAISGGAQAGNREFQFVVQTANKLGLELQSVAGQYRSLSAATRGTALEGTATRDLFTALSRAAQTYGLSTEQLGRALTAMQQIISKGKVSMEELRGQLGEALPGAMQIAARAFGTTTKGLEDLIAKGLDAAEFTRRFTAQLQTELPTAAAKAGAGFVQLGNEILLLKDRAAQSGLLTFLDAAAAKAAAVARALREGEEEQRQRTERTATPTLGLGATLDKLQGDERQKLLNLTEKLTRAEDELLGLQVSRQKRSFGIMTGAIATSGAMAEAQARVDALKKERDAIAATATTRVQQEQAAASRLKEVNEPYVNRKAVIDATKTSNDALTTTFKDQQVAIDKLNKSSATTPEIYGRINGTLQEQITFLEKRKAITEKSLETLTESILARSAKAEPIPTEMVANQEALRRQLREDTAGIKAKQQAIQDAAAAERKAIQDTEAAKRKAKQLAEEEHRKDLQQAEEVARVHASNIEALRSLASRYTEVRAERDADKASILAASLATSQYARESRDLAAAIADVQRIEAQLPALRSAAKGSAAEFEAIQDIMPDFEPDIQLTRREQLAKRFEDLKKVTTDPGTLATAQRRMEETLVIEKQAEMMEHLNDMAEELTNTFVDMAVTGEINFKKLGESFSRMVLDMVADAIDLKGAISGWLKQGLNAAGGGQGGWLQSFMGAGGGAGGGMPTSGTLPTTWAQYDVMSAAGAFGGGMAAGGPVMPGKFYTVGERGPEMLVAGGAGTVIPHGGQTFNMTVVTNDANSFRMNERQIAAQSARMLAHARRNM
jgi:tape measure domain-containing protein